MSVFNPKNIAGKSWNHRTRERDIVSSTANQIGDLVDIRDVAIDRSLPIEERIRSYVSQVKNPYLFKVGDTVVRVSYANTQATISDNFINMIAGM